jgi:hypothetical protein
MTTSLTTRREPGPSEALRSARDERVPRRDQGGGVAVAAAVVVVVGAEVLVVGAAVDEVVGAAVDDVVGAAVDGEVEERGGVVVSRWVPGTCVLPLVWSTGLGCPGTACSSSRQRASSGPYTATLRRSPPSGVRWTPSAVRTRTDVPVGPASVAVYAPLGDANS